LEGVLYEEGYIPHHTGMKSGSGVLVVKIIDIKFANKEAMLVIRPT